MNSSTPFSVTYPITATELRFLPVKAEANRITDLIINSACNGYTSVDFDIPAYKIYDVLCLLFTTFPDVQFNQHRSINNRGTFKASWSLITAMRPPRLQ